MSSSKHISAISKEVKDITAYLDADYLDEINESLSSDDAIPDSDALVSIDRELQEQIDSDSVSPEWIRDNAPWKQYDDESNDEYYMFTVFCNLPISKWDVKDAYAAFLKSSDSQYSEDVLNSFTDAYNKHDWISRRSSYVAYSEWVQRKRNEIEQLTAIANFRNNQALMLNRISNAASSLVEKISKKIESIHPDEISVKDIPSFVSSLSNFLNIASDAEARILAVSELLQMYEEQLHIDRLREHAYGTNLGVDDVTPQELPVAKKSKKKGK